MPRLFNLEPFPVVVDHNELAVLPGGSWDFTDEQVANGIVGMWSERDPRAGVGRQRAFRARRDAHTDPAQPDNKE